MAGLTHEIDQRAGAVQRRAFLVAGDDEADRPCLDWDIGHRRNHRRDGALHVDRAASVEQFTAHFGIESPARPALARWHHVQVPGKGEVAAAGWPGPNSKAVLD